MKNKQVEELLNELKEVTNSKKLSSTYCITNKHWQLLLLYIRELEEENKELKDIAEEPIQIPNFLFDMSQELKIDELEKELQTTANKCKQLENKIKILEEQPCFEVDDKTFCFTFKKWKCSEVIKLSERLEKLENNRDKAIEYNEHLIKHAKYHLNLGHLKKMRKILKGDSDE